MLAAVSFLRMVTRTGAAPSEELPTGRSAIYQTLIATHLFSAIINISAVFVIGQRIALDGSLTSLQARVVSRAFVAAAVGRHCSRPWPWSCTTSRMSTS